MKTLPFNRIKAVNYAKIWALSRNPKYYDFSSIGGDCTNFVSQCVFAGSNQMNYQKETGWYYSSPIDRAPAWTSVEFFYKFITSNENLGPFAKETSKFDMLIGDVVQLGNANGEFYHTLIITEIDNDELFVAAHSFDAFNRPLSSYVYKRIRYLSIQGVRTN